jgi:glutamate synthase (NADPH/NADH) small chain
MVLKTSTSHTEGGQRKWSVLTKEFLGDSRVKKLSCREVEFIDETQTSPSGCNKRCPVMKEVVGSDFEIEADLVILACGFLHPHHSGLVHQLELELDKRGNIKTNEMFMSSKKTVFAAGDARRGQSLIVWAISEGRKVAHAIDTYLMGESNLPSF